MDNKQRSILCIGASTLQKPVLLAAKACGAYVAVTDKHPSNETVAIADEVKAIDATDIEEISNYSKELDKAKPLAGIYSGSDFGLKAVAAVSALFQLPSVSTEVLEHTLTKDRASKIFESNGLLCPKNIILTSANTLNQKLNFPVVIKPVDSSGSRGVTVIKKSSEVESALKEAFDASPSSRVMIEEQICGHHIDVSGIMIDGVFYPAGILDRYFSPEPYRVPVFGIQPPTSIDEPGMIEVYDTLSKAAHALGIQWGPIKGDFILSNNGICILEVSPRFHGDVSTSHVTPRTYDINPVTLWFEYLLNGKKPNFSFLKTDEKFSGWRAIFPKSKGAVTDIKIDRSCAFLNDSDSEIYVHRRAGYYVPSLNDNRSVIGFVWASATSKNQLETKLKALAESVIVKML